MAVLKLEMLISQLAQTSNDIRIAIRMSLLVGAILLFSARVLAIQVKWQHE